MIHERGCGYRVPGGIYLVTDISHNGIPIDLFLFDPPWVPIDTDGNKHYPGALGIDIVRDPNNNNVNHVWDWIGQESYPYFPDFWEETRRFGLSRKVSPNLNFDLLSSESQIIGFHKYGMVSATKAFYKQLEKEFQIGTGMDLYPHINDVIDHFCVKYIWQLVDEAPNQSTGRLHSINLPRNSNETIDYYYAAYIPSWAKKPKYKFEWIPAAMFHLPIHRIEVIEDSIEGKHEIAMETLNKSITNLPFNVVKE